MSSQMLTSGYSLASSTIEVRAMPAASWPRSSLLLRAVPALTPEVEPFIAPNSADQSAGARGIFNIRICFASSA